MKALITKAIAVSAEVRSLTRAKRTIEGLINEELARYNNKTRGPLTEVLNEIKFQIATKKNYVSRLVNSVPLYDERIHMKVNYISSNDEREGYIDISAADVDVWYLDLNAGRIIPADSVPEEKRNKAINTEQGL